MFMELMLHVRHGAKALPPTSHPACPASSLLSYRGADASGDLGSLLDNTDCD